MSWLELYTGPLWMGIKLTIFVILLGIISFLYVELKAYKALYNGLQQSLTECNNKVDSLEDRNKFLNENFKILEKYYQERKEFNPSEGRPNIDNMLKVKPQ